MFGVSLACILYMHPLKADTNKKNYAIHNSVPGEISVVLRRSCIKCHDSAGNETAMAVLNFSKWDTYTAEEQSKKAKMMCTVMTNESMPPIAVRRADAELIPTAAEIEIVCKWSNLYP
jgi:hypothetical protein